MTHFWLLCIEKDFPDTIFRDKLILMKRQIAVPSLSCQEGGGKGRRGRRGRRGRSGGWGGGEEVWGLLWGQPWGRHCFVGGNTWRDYYHKIMLRPCWQLTRVFDKAVSIIDQDFTLLTSLLIRTAYSKTFMTMYGNIKFSSESFLHTVTAILWLGQTSLTNPENVVVPCQNEKVQYWGVRERYYRHGLCWASTLQETALPMMTPSHPPSHPPSPPSDLFCCWRSMSSFVNEVLEMMSTNTTTILFWRLSEICAWSDPTSTTKGTIIDWVLSKNVLTCSDWTTS